MYENLGSKIKELRKDKRLTLKQIAEKTNLSISFLSQLEHGKTSATLESLKKISESLDVYPSYFFSKPETKSNSNIVRNIMNENDLQENKFIYRDLSGRMERPLFYPNLIILNPGDNSGKNFSHQGQEFLYILEGILTVLIDDNEYVLKPYDCIFIDSARPHYWLNKTEKSVKFLCISSSERFNS
ncbi:cupin domain-containing protein [Bacillus sp. DTU_2020_1000418_1_SI_GHA_SEK_038]|uniref:helix-turn-helix domain-containing protein n=1 Tax=Bacillus sp. DTU_2020_1000418_1_SI_GHA_SEK_038 TaxID=3077585 RepID=UPI0028E2E6A3|nr:cupin domain-containing protein [Bacillus sp. DTU_2020_1000418_1_SI_GHA_SEK_038]WNS75169.1 cupin domain-containing protein [Bacillus sp. DTU_2020_1000418_1_SI_GHA_SEK_038]